MSHDTRHNSQPEKSAATREALSADMRAILGGEAVSNFGSMLSRLAIPWLAALSLGAGPMGMAGLLIADVACGAVGAATLGQAIDRCKPRSVMLLADVGRAAVLACIAIYAYLGVLSMLQLTAASGLTGLMTVVFEMARSAWLARHVPQSQLVGHNAQLAIATSLSETVAFAVCGWLYQGLGAVVALTLDALSFIVSACLVKRLRAPETLPTFAAAEAPLLEEQPVAANSFSAWSKIKHHPQLRTLAILTGLCALNSGMMATNYMVHTAKTLNYSPGVLGMVFAAGGLGALLGARWAPSVGQKLGSMGALGAGLLVNAFATALVAFAPISQPNGLIQGALLVNVIGLTLLTTHQVLGDMGQTLFQVHESTLRQTAADAGTWAQLDGAFRALVLSVTLLAGLLGGALGSAFGTHCAIVVAACALLAAAAVAFNRAIALSAATTH